MAMTPFPPVSTTLLLQPRGRAWSPRRERAASGVEGEAVAAYLSALQAEPEPLTRLQRGVDLLPTLVHGCHHASLTTVLGGRLEVRVATDDTSQRADELQDELDEGPSLQAVRTGHSVVAQDLRTENRWLDWCTAAVDELGVRSALSVLLPSTLQPLGTVNVYSNIDHGLVKVDLGLLNTLTRPLAGALLDICIGAARLGPAA